MSAAERRARFRAQHERNQLFVMPNPWDAGSARLLESLGFEALATTSQGHAWALGRLDYAVGRDELVAHVGALAAATGLPLNVDGADCFPREPGGVAETVRLLADAGAAGCSIEDWDPVEERLIDLHAAVARVAQAAEAARAVDPPLLLTARAENLLRGADDLDDTVRRLVAYRDAGADCLYAPGLRTIADVERVVEAAAGAPVNVLALPGAPSLPELAAAGVRRVSTGSQLAAVAYTALLRAAEELGRGSTGYAEGAAGDAIRAALA